MSELILVWSLVVSASLSAPPEQKPLELGVYLPRLTLVTPEARNAHAEAVGDTLSKALGRPVHGRAFANVSDLDAFIDAGRLGHQVDKNATVRLNKMRRHIGYPQTDMEVGNTSCGGGLYPTAPRCQG